MSKTIIFDIESYDLRANRGWLVCVGWKEAGKSKIHMIGPDTKKTRKATMYTIQGHPYTGRQMVNYTPFDDRDVVAKTFEVLSEAGEVVTHYGDRHDIPFINTRLIGHKLPVLPQFLSNDLWRIARYQLNLTRNGLAQVSEFLQSAHKYHVTMDEWQRACVQGDARCMEKIIKHCREDVRMTDQNREKLLGLAKKSTNLAVGKDEGTCPKCGKAGYLVMSGKRPTTTGFVQRYFCKSCMCWSSSGPKSQRGVLR